MTGADNFVENCKKILREKVYTEFRSPKVYVSNPLTPKDIATIKAETGVEPEHELLVYEPTGHKLYGYYEYIYHETIIR